jgi:predicted double-glycine peptidase
MENDFEKNLLNLLEEYYHYKYMTSGFFKSMLTNENGMSFYDFIQWLKSKN